MATNLLDEATGRFGKYLADAMTRSDKDARALAAELESSYEHIRKLVKGLALPSPYILDKMSKAMKGFSMKEAQLLADQDRAQRTFKKNFNQLAGIPEDAGDLLKSWEYISEDHKRTIMTMVNAFEREDRGARRR